MSSYTTSRTRLFIALLSVLLFGLAAYSLSHGALPTDFADIFAALPQSFAHFFGLGANPDPPQLVLVLAEIRIPRLFLAILVGAGLAMCGAVMQGLFRNPMADPGLLGVSSGAALGAVLSIVLGQQLFAVSLRASALGAWLLPLMAFAGGALSILVVHRLSVLNGKTDIATMLLAGIAVNAITGALIGLLSYLAAAEQLRGILFWGLGSLEGVERHKILICLLLTLPVLAWLPRYAAALNANLLGEREAQHLGIDMEKVKQRLILLVALVVGSLVSLSGIIGFVGLVVPHLVRLIIGPDHRILLTTAALSGAILLLATDLVARSVVAPAEIPIGIITALLGAPFFLYLLVRASRNKAVT